MTAADPLPLSDTEIVVMRVPPNAPWFEPPDRVSSANFKLNSRRGDLGLSVYRLSVIRSADVLARPDALPGSRLVVSTVGDIRRACDAAGHALGLDVVATDDGGSNPGHADIRGPVPGKLSSAASKALQRLFRLYAEA